MSASAPGLAARSTSSLEIQDGDSIDVVVKHQAGFPRYKMPTSTRQCLLKLQPEDLYTELSDEEMMRLRETVDAALHATKLRMRARSIRLPDLQDDLLLKIIDCMTTSEGRGLLLCCTRLSGLARPNVFLKRQREARIFVFLLI